MITDERTRGEIIGALRHAGHSQGSVTHAAAADELERLWAIVDANTSQPFATVVQRLKSAGFPILAELLGMNEGDLLKQEAVDAQVLPRKKE